MGGIKVKIHPLFYLLGLYFAITGKIFIFIIYTATAVIHELGHSYVASNQGYRLNKITLMPFGAVVSGNIEGLKPTDEIKVAVAGPFINLAVALFFVSTWWIFPESYAFTDVVAEANFIMAVINFLPVFPLDGGRIVLALLSSKMNKIKAIKIMKVSGIIFSLILFALFVVTIFYTINISILLFALFLLFATLSREKDNVYVRLTSITIDKRALNNGIIIKKQAVDKDITLKKLISILDYTCINEIDVYSNGEKITNLNQNKINEVVLKGELYSKLSKYL